MLDPTLGIPTDFKTFVQDREAERNAHLIDGIPDYAFSLDWEIRRKLDKLVPLRKLAEALTAGTVPVQRALFEMSGVAVGPDQFPQVHELGVRCADRLGIGVPQLFVVQNPIINAFTFATGEVDQIIVLTSGLLETCSEKELMCVIGHECGHIHNRHVVYNTLWEVLTNNLARGLLSTLLRNLVRSSLVVALLDMVFRGASALLFQRWHRCAEITCDRAGLICTGDLQVSLDLPGKLSMGHVGAMKGFNSDAYSKQMKTFSKSTLKVLELFQTHPLGPVRVQAIDAFKDCEVLHSWRPELAGESKRSKTTVDKEIEGMFL